MITKQEAVLNELRIRPSTVSELVDKFWPNITYAHIRTMTSRLYKEGILEVASVEQAPMPQGGSKEVYRYMVTDTVHTDEDILPVRRKVVIKGKNAKPDLTHAKLSKELRRELVMKQNPLFVMFFGKKYL